MYTNHLQTDELSDAAGVHVQPASQLLPSGKSNSRSLVCGERFHKKLVQCRDNVADVGPALSHSLAITGYFAQQAGSIHPMLF